MENSPFALITEYLEGNLDAETRARFEATVRVNPELAAELALYRDMYTALTPGPEDAIRKNLEMLGKKHTGTGWSFKKWKIPVLLITLLLSVLLVYRFLIYAPAPMPDPVQPPAPEKVSPAVNEPVQKIEKSQPSEPQRSAPMAAAFRPNPQLEKMIGNTYRSAARKFKIISPLADVALKSANRKTVFTLSGIIETPEKAIDQPFRALIFSNDPDAFEKFQFVWVASLQLENVNHSFAFSRTEMLDLPPGLYYLVVEEESSGMTCYTGRFRIVE